MSAGLQPGPPAVEAAGLPGSRRGRLDGLAIAAALAIALISMLLGQPGGQGHFKGAPWVTLMLGFGLLNTSCSAPGSGWPTWWAR